MILIYDTETTGMYDFKRKPDHPSQPHLVQYAGLLVDRKSQRPVHAFATIVDPGVPIPKEAANIHGITTEMAQRVGAKPYVALDWHLDALEKASLAVAHNISFDRRIMDTVAARAGGGVQPSKVGVKEYCTMKNGTDLCKLPGRYGNHKWPKLEELHQHLFKESFPAHDALADVQACARCYFAMMDSKPVEPGPEMVTVPARCPLCGELLGIRPSGSTNLKYTCGCQIDRSGKVLVPCAADVPKK